MQSGSRFITFGSSILPLTMVAAALAAPGCETGTAPAVDAGPDAGADTLEVLVTDGVTGLEGVQVAADLVDGGRIEGTSDAGGVVTFPIGVDGLAGLIAHRDGFTFAAMTPAAVVDALEADLPVSLTIVPIPPPVGVPHEGTANVRGALLSRVEGARAVISTTEARGFVDKAPGTTSYSIPVPINRPFTLVTAQYTPVLSDTRTFEELHHGWTLIDHEPIAADTTIDIDFATSAALTTVTGTIPAPAHERLRTGASLNVLISAGAPTVHVGTPPGNGYVGFASRSAPLPGDTGYEFVADYVDLPGRNIFTLFFLQLPVDDLGNEWLVFAYVDGLPQAFNDVEFLSPPHRTTPARGARLGAPEPWDTPISWTVSDEDAELVWIVYTSGGSTIGVIDVSARDRAVTLSDLPSTSTFLSRDSFIGGHVSTYRSTDDDPEFELVSTEGAFPVADFFAR